MSSLAETKVTWLLKYMHVKPKILVFFKLQFDGGIVIANKFKLSVRYLR